MTEPLKRRTTTATKRRYDTNKIMLDAAELHEISALELSYMFQISDSGARKYISAAIAGGALVKKTEASREDGRQSSYKIVSKEAADAYLATIPSGAPTAPQRTRPSATQLRIDAAALEGRRFIIKSDAGEVFRMPDREPVVRDPLISAFFGPAVAP